MRHDATKVLRQFEIEVMLKEITCLKKSFPWRG
jgi:hypothetical protein